MTMATLVTIILNVVLSPESVAQPSDVHTVSVGTGQEQRIAQMLFLSNNLVVYLKICCCIISLVICLLSIIVIGRGGL